MHPRLLLQHTQPALVNAGEVGYTSLCPLIGRIRSNQGAIAFYDKACLRVSDARMGRAENPEGGWHQPNPHNNNYPDHHNDSSPKMAPGGRGTSRGSSAGSSRNTSGSGSLAPSVALPTTSAVAVAPPQPRCRVPVKFRTRVVRPDRVIEVPWRSLLKNGEAALAPRDVIEAVYALEAVKALHEEGGVLVQVRLGVSIDR